MRDEELQALAAAGDSGAEETLIRNYYRVIRSMVRPYFLVGGDSEDLLQEGMLGLLSAIRTYDAGVSVSFRSYAQLCIRRRIYTAIRNAAGTKNVSLDDCLSLESSLFENQPQNQELRNPEEILILREDAQKRYRDLLQQLSSLEAQVLHCFLKGMSYREIAETTGRPEKAVDNAVQRIRRKFAKTQKDPSDYSFG